MKNQYSKKKIVGLISKSLSSLDLRLIKYGNYTKVSLEIDELTKIEEMLSNSIQFSKEYIVFNIDNISSKIFNYSVVLLPIKKIFQLIFINKYGYNNLIYLPLAKNNEEDPFSFYSLDNIVKDKKSWKMECRLEEIGNYIINNLLPYTINIFKTIYKTVFNDNDYRKNFEKDCPILQEDCYHLLNNIIILAQPLKVSKIFREIIVEK